jgi:hypothetical protein
MTGQFSWLIGTDKEWLEKCAEIHSIVDGYIEEEIERQKRPEIRDYRLIPRLSRRFITTFFLRSWLENTQTTTLYSK